MRRPPTRRVVPLAGVALLLAALTVAGPGTAVADAGSNALAPGERLTAGQALVAGNAQVIVQDDGNLVERIASRAVWATHTEGRPGSTLTLQTDGNLVLRSPDGVARWNSGTVNSEPGDAYLDAATGNFGVYPASGGALWDNGIGIHRPPSVLGPGQVVTSAATTPAMQSPDDRIELTVEPNAVTANETSHEYTTVLWEQDGRSVRGAHAGQLAMQTDGNLVLRGPDGAAYWSSRTFVRGSSFSVQSDGNFVVRGPDGRAVWALGTSRVLLGAGEQASAGTRFVSRYTSPGPSNYAVFQTDGNLVGRDGAGRATWASGTAGHPGSRLVMQTDGNLVVYGPDNRAVWSTRTGGCGVGVVFNTVSAAVETSHGTVWQAAVGREHC